MARNRAKQASLIISERRFSFFHDALVSGAIIQMIVLSRRPYLHNQAHGGGVAKYEEDKLSSCKFDQCGIPHQRT